MSIRFKINVLEALKGANYNTNKLRQEKIFGEATIQHLRKGEMVSLGTINEICRIRQCQPGDIIEYTEDSEC